MAKPDGAAEARPRPAFYALSAGAWRDYVTLLHPPYTAWHLSYVVVGAALAPSLDVSRLVLTLVAFFLAVGVAAHCLDELNGRPLRTGVPARALWGLTVAGLAGAVAIGAWGVHVVGWPLAVLVAIGVLLVPSYNLEWFGGRLHSDWMFAASWGAFPVLASYVGQTGAIGWAALAGAGYAFASSLAQRILSTWARALRRRAVSARARIVWRGGEESELDARELIAPAEGALRAMTAACLLVAAALLALQLAR